MRGTTHLSTTYLLQKVVPLLAIAVLVLSVWALASTYLLITTRETIITQPATIGKYQVAVNKTNEEGLKLWADNFVTQIISTHAENLDMKTVQLAPFVDTPIMLIMESFLRDRITKGNDIGSFIVKHDNIVVKSVDEGVVAVEVEAKPLSATGKDPIAYSETFAFQIKIDNYSAKIVNFTACTGKMIRDEGFNEFSAASPMEACTPNVVELKK